MFTGGWAEKIETFQIKSPDLQTQSVFFFLFSLQIIVWQYNARRHLLSERFLSLWWNSTLHRDYDGILNSSCLLITSFPSGKDKDVNVILHRLEMIFSQGRRHTLAGGRLLCEHSRSTESFHLKQRQSGQSSGSHSHRMDPRGTDWVQHQVAGFTPQPVGEARNQVMLLQYRPADPAGVAGTAGGDEKVGGWNVRQVYRRR